MEAFDTDNLVWLQARGRLDLCYGCYGRKWPKMKNGLGIAVAVALNFFKKYGQDKEGKTVIFSLMKVCEPLIQPYNYFFGLVFTMAFSRLSKIYPK